MQKVTWARKMVKRPRETPDGDEGHEQADAHQDLGDDERRVDQGVVDALEAGLGEAMQGQGRGRAQDERDDGDQGGDDQGVAGGRPDLGLVQKPLVPDQREALPARAEARGVEGIDDQDDDGQVEEEKHQAHDHEGEAAVFHASSRTMTSRLFLVLLALQDRGWPEGAPGRPG